jgi:hypothetical protein
MPYALRLGRQPYALRLTPFIGYSHLLKAAKLKNPQIFLRILPAIKKYCVLNGLCYWRRGSAIISQPLTKRVQRTENVTSNK